MADVIDILVRTTYEANTGGIDKGNAALDKAIDLIADQGDEIKRLEAIRAAADKKNLDQINQLNKAITDLKNKQLQEVAAMQKTINENSKLTTALQRQIQVLGRLSQAKNQSVTALNNVSKSSNTAAFALTNLGRVAQDAPFGFLGIANNLNPLLESFQRLRAETGSNKTALAALTSSLTGPAGIGIALSVVSSLLIVFGDELFKSSKAAGEAAESYKKFTDAISSDISGALRNIDEQTGKIKVLKGIIDSTTASEEQREKAIKAIQAQFPSLTREQVLRSDLLGVIEQEVRAKETSNFASEQAVKFSERARKLRGDEAKAIANVTKAEQDLTRARAKNIGSVASQEVIASAAAALKRAQDARASIAAEISGMEGFARAAEQKAVDEAINAGDSFFDKEAKGKDPYQLALDRIDDQQKLSALNDEALQMIRARIQSILEVQREINESRVELGLSIPTEQREAEAVQIGKEIAILESFMKARTLAIEVSSNLQRVSVAKQFGKPIDAGEFEIKAQEADLELSKLSINVREPIDAINITTPGIDRDAINRAMQANRQMQPKFKLPGEDDKLIQDQLKKIEGYYTSFANNIAATFQSISDFQIALLDNEIEVRKRRVTEAEELAKRGNTEVLRLETERLEKAEKRREDAANRQLQIDAALKASAAAIVAVQALQSVTNAAATGDPYSGAVRIAAVIAALGAGFAFVTSLVQAFNSGNNNFKDGVVGLEGPGTSRSDSIPARLSRGESVITAEATQKYRPLLEAMNAGVPLPITLSRAGSEGGFATQKELARLGDRLEGAISNISFRAVNKLDANGAMQTIEAMQRVNRRRRS